MPTADRKPRRRRRSGDTQIPTETVNDLQVEAWLATAEDWNNGLRRRFIRAYITKGHSEQDAIAFAGIAERKPKYILKRPPSDILPKLRESGKI